VLAAADAITTLRIKNALTLDDIVTDTACKRRRSE